MKHFFLKFNHGVELGAAMAYTSHLLRTKDKQIYLIAKEEMAHAKQIRGMLADLGTKSSILIDIPFYVIGSVVQFFCKICPLSWLNWVARTMEVFAITNYTQLSKTYPQYEVQFLEMAETEKRHEKYFTK